MKTFNTDNPYIRYALLFIGAIIGAFTGTVAGTILLGVLFKR